MPSLPHALRRHVTCGLAVASLAAGSAALAPTADAASHARRVWFTCSGVTNASTIVSTTMAGGIRVNRCMQWAVRRMVGDASASGIWLTGSGWRDESSQVALRKINCGGSDYHTVWQKAPSSCHPATAIPGRSLHERGLAIDFMTGGSHISRSSQAYRWLAAHAGEYGLYNLSSEPWHWSATGG